MEDQEIEYCKNKHCNRPLPNGGKHKYCEVCRNRKVKKLEDIGKGADSILGVAFWDV